MAGPESADISTLPKPQKRELEDEIGISANLPFTMPYRTGKNGSTTYEIFPTEENEDEPSVKQLMTMRRTDGQARSLYRLITLPIRSALRTSTFQAAPGGEKEAQFIRDMFTLPAVSGGMQTPFSSVIASMLTAIFDGFSTFEQVYRIPRTGPLAGKVTLHKLAYRPSDTVTFLLDEHGQMDGIRQQAIMHGRSLDVFIPGDRVFRYTAQDEERPFYGVSYFQSAFSHYVKKVKLYYLAHLSAQHRAVGTRKGRVPRSASPLNRANFKKALADFGVAQAILLPEGFEIETDYPSSSFDFLQLINHHNSQMSKSVLAGFLDESQGGSKTLVDFSKQSDAMFMLMLQTIMDELAEAVNLQLIPKFVKWNFDSDKYPKFQWGAFTDEQRTAIAELFSKLSVAGPGINVTRDFMFEMEQKMAHELGFDLDYVRIGKEVKEKQALADAKEAAESPLVQQFGSEDFGNTEEGAGQSESAGEEEPADDGFWSVPEDEAPAKK